MAEQAKPDGKDIGYVGTVKHVDTKIIYDLLDDDFLPIIYPIGIGEDGQSFIITGGMIPKVQNCLKAIEGGVNWVHILDGRIPHCLLLEIFTDRGCGTAIMNPEETRYYNR